jgi:hypothetical protein
VPWRIALDYRWSQDSRALDYLQGSFGLLRDEYQNTGRLAATYSHDGVALDQGENPAMYATALTAFTLTDKKLADKMYQEKIIKLYSNKENSFVSTVGYYEQNLLWFGTAFYHNALDDYQD